MPTHVQVLIEELDAFRPADDGECVGQLYALLEGFESLEERLQAVPAMFRVLERFPDADLGSPGPLVHAIESTADDESLLRRSFGTAPTALTAWMINRILNSRLASADRAEWLELLSDVAERRSALRPPEEKPQSSWRINGDDLELVSSRRPRREVARSSRSFEAALGRAAMRIRPRLAPRLKLSIEVCFGLDRCAGEA